MTKLACRRKSSFGLMVWEGKKFTIIMEGMEVSWSRKLGFHILTTSTNQRNELGINALGSQSPLKVKFFVRTAGSQITTQRCIINYKCLANSLDLFLTSCYNLNQPFPVIWVLPQHHLPHLRTFHAASSKSGWGPLRLHPSSPQHSLCPQNSA